MAASCCGAAQQQLIAPRSFGRAVATLASPPAVASTANRRTAGIVCAANPSGTSGTPAKEPQSRTESDRVTGPTHAGHASLSDLKNKYASLIRRQQSSASGFSLTPEPAKQLSSGSQQLEGDDAQLQQPAQGPGFVRVSPLLAVQENKRVRLKLGKFMAAHIKAERQQVEQQQKDPKQQELKQRPQAANPAADAGADAGAGAEAGTSPAVASPSTALSPAAPSRSDEQPSSSQRATGPAPSTSGTQRTSAAPVAAAAAAATATAGATVAAAATRAAAARSPASPPQLPDPESLTPATMTERRSSDASFLSSMKSKARATKSDLLNSVAEALMGSVASLSDQTSWSGAAGKPLQDPAQGKRATPKASAPEASAPTGPAPVPGQASPSPVTAMPAMRLPSMAYPRWRQVPGPVQQRLLRLRSSDYDLTARRGYARRLDVMVTERRKAKAVRGMAAAGGAAALAAGAAYALQDQQQGQRAPQQPARPAGQPSSAASRDQGRADAGEGASGQESEWGAYHAGVEAVSDQLRRLLGEGPGDDWQLPRKAYYGRRGEQLAAMSPKDVRTQVGLWLDIAGPQYTRRFLEKEPTLLVRHPAWLLEGLETFNQVLELEPDKCVQFALRNSALIGISRERLEEVIVQVGEALAVSLADARRMVIKNTTLATIPGSISERLEVLATILPVSRSRLSSMVRQRPTLLTQSAVRIALAIAELSNVTRLPLFNAALLAAGAPALLGMSTEVMRDRMLRLRQLTGLYPPWKQQLAEMSPAALARCLVASDSAIERLARCLGLKPGAPTAGAVAAAAAAAAGPASAASGAASEGESTAPSEAASAVPAAAGQGAAANSGTAGLRIAPRARNLKVHRILSMTDNAFDSLLATPPGRAQGRAGAGAGGTGAGLDGWGGSVGGVHVNMHQATVSVGPGSEVTVGGFGGRPTSAAGRAEAVPLGR